MLNQLDAEICMFSNGSFFFQAEHDEGQSIKELKSQLNHLQFFVEKFINAQKYDQEKLIRNVTETMRNLQHEKRENQVM